MPGRPKSGPPYTDVPNEVYVVVTRPWGMHNNPRSRVQGDFDRIASWAQFALQQAGLTGGSIPTVECVYAMGTRDEVILQFPEGTNILPLLGEHRWANFWTNCNPNDPRSTRVFLYNWRNNGDPANHNWTENFPNGLSFDKIPAKSPYPTPSWASPPSTLTNLVLPIPPPQIPPPILNHAPHPDKEQQSVISPPPSTVTPSPAPSQQRDQTVHSGQTVAQGPAPTSLFRPYEPPSHHPSHGRFLNQSQARDGEASSSKASPPSPKFVKKLDPYELEEDALDFIRSSVFEEDTKESKLENIEPTPSLSVKAETQEIKKEEEAHNVIDPGSGYQPSQALVDAFNTLQQHEQSPSSTPPFVDPQELNTIPEIKTEEDTHHTVSHPGYRPSQALIDAFNSLHQHESSPSTAPLSRSSRKRGVRDTPVSLPSGSHARLTPSTRVVAVKREYEDDITAFSGKRTKIKVEED